MVGVGSGMEMG